MSGGGGTLARRRDVGEEVGRWGGGGTLARRSDVVVGGTPGSRV